MLFAGAGYNVMIYDILTEQVDNALKDIKEQMNCMQSKGLLRGKFTAEEQISLIKGINKFVF